MPRRSKSGDNNHISLSLVPRRKLNKSLLIKSASVLALLAMVAHNYMTYSEKNSVREELSNIRTSLINIKTALTNIGYSYDVLYSEINELSQIAKFVAPPQGATGKSQYSLTICNSKTDPSKIHMKSISDSVDDEFLELETGPDIGIKTQGSHKLSEKYKCIREKDVLIREIHKAVPIVFDGSSEHIYHVNNATNSTKTFLISS